MKRIFYPLLLTSFFGCAMRNYTYYLVDPPIEKSELIKSSTSEIIRQRSAPIKSSQALKVRWNDGQLFTEVDVPLLESGQYIVVDHKQSKGLDSTLSHSSVVPPPPSKADQSLAEAYKEKGLKENPAAAQVSITKSRVLVQDAIKTGNYSLALEYVELVLVRYHSHPEFLRAKGSILLLLGEKEKAILTYEKAEEMESDPGVRKKLEELRKSQK